MKLKDIKLYISLFIFTLVMSGCISDGDETYVLEEPGIEASKMIIGGWRKSNVKVLDEDGNEVHNSAIEGSLEEIPDITFDEEGNYTITYTDGKTETGKWNISDDEEYLYLDGTNWEIYSFGEDKLVIIYEYFYKGKYYYIMYIFDRASSPAPEEGGEDGGMPGLGDVSDNNPYKPWGKNLVSKITLTRRYTDDNTVSKTVYLFQYDKKSRIIEYTEQSYNTLNNTVTKTNKFNFTYDDSKVYLYYNGELMNYGVIGANGYLTTLYEGNSTTVNSTFRYDSDGYVTYLKTDNQEWEPVYKSSSWIGNKDMISPEKGGDVLSYNSDALNNISVDFNGLVTTSYQWEWFMHYDYSGVVFGLFDFYGKRTQQIATKVVRGVHWTDEMTDWEIKDSATGDYVITLYQMTRTGLNNPFVATYEIEYYE